MGKQEFLDKLRKGLSGLPHDEAEERLVFYSDMIDDRMEEGLSEEEAVSEMGTVNEVVSQITPEIPLSKLVKEKVRSKRTVHLWEIVLLVLGAPIWLSLFIAVLAVMLAVYMAVWSVIASLWAIQVSFAACSLGGAAATAAFTLTGHGYTGLAMLGVGLFCAGLSIFLFFGCRAATLGLLMLTKKIALGCKSIFLKKEGAK